MKMNTVVFLKKKISVETSTFGPGSKFFSEESKCICETPP